MAQVRRIHLIVMTLTFTALAGTSKAFAAKPGKCSGFFKSEAATRISANGKKRKMSESWDQSRIAIEQVRKKVYGVDSLLRPIIAAAIAREFVWMNGDPGGAKTYSAKLIFEAILDSVPDQDKKIFILQFHKLITEGKILGWPKFTELMKNGRYVIETKSSLVGNDFLLLIADEAEKASPATLNALLSLLNERKAFHGTRVIDAALASGVFTSNKTSGKFVQGFGDDFSSAEALLDRMPVKINMPNQFATPKETANYILSKKRNKAIGVGQMPLLELSPLLDKVEIPPEIVTDLIKIIRPFDEYVTDKMDSSRKKVRFGEAEVENFPANQFSNRSWGRMMNLFKASFIMDQLWSGVPASEIRMKIERRDLHLLSIASITNSLARVKHRSFPMGVETDKGVKYHEIIVDDEYWAPNTMHGEWNPWERELTLKHEKTGEVRMIVKVGKDGSFQTRYQEKEFNLSPEGNEKQPAQILKWIKEAEETHKVDLAKVQFQEDEALEKLSNSPTVVRGSKEEYASILEDTKDLIKKLNDRMEVKPERIGDERTGSLESGISLAEYRELMRKAKNDEDRLRINYEVSRRGFAAIEQRFLELEHSIEAHFTAILGNTHIFSFGGPGGAKTSLAQTILSAELRHMHHSQARAMIEDFLKNAKTRGDLPKNKEFIRAVLANMHQSKPELYRTFVQQFHKLLPEGVLVGFPKVELQLEQGIEEIEIKSSMAGAKFLFAILDEVDKANPQTLTALLGLLNERIVMSGGKTFKSPLRTAIMTSNKMPSEMLESFKEDRESGSALMDRAINKVYVPNKFTTEEALFRFLMDREKKVNNSWTGVLAISSLEPLMKKVHMEDHIVHLLMEIEAKFSGRRLIKEEEAYTAFKQDGGRESPDYYLRASISSNRTKDAIIEEMSSRLIISQIRAGVPYEKLRFEFEVKDAHLFFEGMAYWAPQKLSSFYDEQGIIKFKLENEKIDKFATAAFVPERQRYHANKMKEEGVDMVEILNLEIRGFVTEYRELIAKFPNLFPSLFANDQARKKALADVDAKAEAAAAEKKKGGK